MNEAINISVIEDRICFSIGEVFQYLTVGIGNVIVLVIPTWGRRRSSSLASECPPYSLFLSTLNHLPPSKFILTSIHNKIQNKILTILLNNISIT